MKVIVIATVLAVFLVGCVSLQPEDGDQCKGHFTPINKAKY